MKKYYVITALLLSFFLTACASSQADHIIDQSAVAATSAVSSHFAVVLKEAESGDKNSQYAVGYMYYYGKSVGQNIDLGKAWIKKAALNGQVQALEAAKLLSVDLVKHAKSAKSIIVKSKVKAKSTAIKAHVVKKQLLAHKNISAVKNPVVKNKVLVGKAAVKYFSSHKEMLYTLQLYGGSDQDKLVKLAQKLQKNIKQQLFVYQSSYKGRPWYLCLMGSYAGYSLAKKDLEMVSMELKALHPWVKSIAHL